VVRFMNDGQNKGIDYMSFKEVKDQISLHRFVKSRKRAL